MSGQGIMHCLQDTGATYAPARIRSGPSLSSVFYYVMPPKKFMLGDSHRLEFTRVAAPESPQHDILRWHHVYKTEL